jgi:hypothetical protein
MQLKRDSSYLQNVRRVFPTIGLAEYGMHENCNAQSLNSLIMEDLEGNATVTCTILHEHATLNLNLSANCLGK